MALRLWARNFESDEALDGVLANIERNPGCCDEVWLASTDNFPTIEVHRKAAERMTIAAERFREIGIIASLELRCSLGHSDSFSDESSLDTDGMTWQTMVGPDGRAAATCACPRDASLHEYLRKIAALYAAWQPWACWIDDDMRMVHHAPIDYPCFCEHCLADFAKSSGVTRRREQLVEAINADLSVREEWTRFNGESIAIAARAIAEGVHAAAPHCRMGLEQCEHENTLYSGPDVTPLHQALADATSLPTGARPGGGHYVEHHPRTMINKALRIGRQIARAAPCVQRNCAEIESFPHVVLSKTPRAIAVESALYLAAGCDGLSYAVLCTGMEPTDRYEPILKRLGQWRPFLETYRDANTGTASGGLSVVLGRDHIAADARIAPEPFGWSRANVHDAYQLAEIGLPLCCDSAGACGVFISPNAAMGLTRDELHTALQMGAVADGEGVNRLQQRGMSDLLGAEVVAGPTDCFEQLSEDPLNGPHRGRLWGQYFHPDGAPQRIVAPAERIRVLGEYTDRNGKRHGAATGLVDTPSGGRLAILGYWGLSTVVSSARRAQLLAAADWASGHRLPAILHSPAQAAVFLRVDDAGELRSVMLLNATMDTTGELELLARSSRAQWRWLSPEVSEHTLVAESGEDGSRLVLPPLAPWSVACLIP